MNVLSLVTNKHASFYQQQVTALRERGLDVDTVAPTRQFLDHESRVTSSRSVGDYLGLYKSVLKRQLESYDIVHANYATTSLFALAQIHRPVVVSFWGSDLYGRWGQLTRLCARLCDEVIVMSEPMADDLETDVSIIPHGVDLDTFRPMERQLAQQSTGWNSDYKHILFPYSTSRSVKNYPLAEQTVELARQNISDQVELHALANVPHSEVPVYMNAADVMLLTSDREGSPNTVKEAIACNLPVVATDVGDVSYRLLDIEPSRVCNADSEALANALVEVLERDERSNGREHATQISLERMTEDIINVYRRAANSP